MLLAWGILAPSGIYVARYMRDRLWFPYHRGFMLATVLASSAGSFLAFWFCESHLNKPHKIIGPVVNALMILQIVGGLLAHRWRDPTRLERPLLNRMHRCVGGLTLLLAWTNIGFGVHDHPRWPVWAKWTLALGYFSFVALVFGRSEVLLWKSGAQRLPATPTA